jgi:dephospho-CoA kinase
VRSAGAICEVWGLTGGVASGKTTVARFFEAEGVMVLDADQIARDLSSEGGKAYPAILKRFGTNDRRKLRQMIFIDDKAREDLEAILHPMIRDESYARMAAASKVSRLRAKDGRVPVIYEAALLVESGRFREFEGLIVVQASRDVRMQRLVNRDRIEEALADHMISSQISDAERGKVASQIWENAGYAEEMRAKVRDFISKQGWAIPSRG